MDGGGSQRVQNQRTKCKNPASNMESSGFFRLCPYWSKCQQGHLTGGIWAGLMKEGTKEAGLCGTADLLISGTACACACVYVCSWRPWQGACPARDILADLHSQSGGEAWSLLLVHVGHPLHLDCSPCCSLRSMRRGLTS